MTTYKTKDNRNVCGGSQVYIEEKKRRNELYIYKLKLLLVNRSSNQFNLNEVVVFYRVYSDESSKLHSLDQ